jgi:hypothetical protein
MQCLEQAYLPFKIGFPAVVEDPFAVGLELNEDKSELFH